MGGWGWRMSEGDCGGRGGPLGEGRRRGAHIFGIGRGWGGGFGPNIHFEFGPGPRGGGGGNGGRGRRSRMFGSGELRLLLLKLIADEPRHGYDLIRAIEALTEGAYAPSPGVIYPTLTLLGDMGLIEEGASEGARKPFRVTEAGREHLAANADEVTALIERLEGAGSERSKGRSPHLGRAVGNLMQALRNRVSHDGWDEALVHEVTAILDEAAQRIERLK
jgi:DNA-binding PadR family transcriptional regulator